MDVKTQQKGYISLLMLACQQGSIYQIQELLSKPETENSSLSSSVLAVDQTGRSALHYCAEYSRFDCADFLLSNISEDEVKQLVDIADHEGFTALLIAVINGNIQLLGLLIGKGASVDAQDKELHTPIHWATVCGHFNCLDLLLEQKAEASSPDIHGAYPIHYAAQMSTATTAGGSASATVRTNADVIGTPSPGPPSRNLTPTNQGFRFLQRLIEYGVPVSPLDLDRRQPLLWAASSGATDACALLVKSGSDPELGDKDGLTALHCAASRGHLDCLKVLIEECRARVDVKDKHECTPLMYAATLGYIDCIRYLNGCGADKNHQDRKGRSAAHLAASKGQTESIMELEDLGGNIWLRNLRGDFPLQEAAQAGYIGVLEFLLSRKSDVISSTNNDGRSCLHIAAMQKDFALCQFLVENKINVNLVMHNTKRQYFTALDLANAKNNTEMSRYLRAHGALDAVTVTGKAASRIQKTFSKFTKDKATTQQPLDPNGILEEAFETGAQPSLGGLSRRVSLRNGDDLEDELVMLESDSSYLPHLPREVSSSPTDIGMRVQKERHSDYDAIMDASVLGATSTFNSNYGFPASSSDGTRRTSDQPLFDMPTTAEHEEELPRESPPTPLPVVQQPVSVDPVFARTLSGPVQPNPTTPALQLFATSENGIQSTVLNSGSISTPGPGLISRAATPVFEMSTLALNEDTPEVGKNASHSSLVKYDTDSGSDDDMKHPQHRSRFMRSLMSQNDMSHASSGAGLKRMSFSRSYNSFLVEPTPDFRHPKPLLKNTREVHSKEKEESVSSPEPISDHESVKNSPTDAVSPETIHSQTKVHTTSATTSQSTQMTPRNARPVASRDMASSPRRGHTKELETQTDPHMSTIDENSDIGEPALSSRLSSSASGPQSDKSDMGLQTSISSAWDSSTVGVQTNHPPVTKDSGVSARSTAVNDFDTQTAARELDHAGTQTAKLESARRKDFGASARKLENGENATQTLNKQLSENEVQTTPRSSDFNRIHPLSFERRALSSQESQTSSRVLQKQPNISGLFTGDSREHKNSSSGDLGQNTPPAFDDTLPDSFVPPIMIERRKSRLRWDETAGVMPDATMMRNSSRRASFTSDARPELIAFGMMPSLPGVVTHGRGEIRYQTSESVNEEPEHEAVAEAENGILVEPEKENKKEQEDHHTEMYKKFRPPTPRVPSLKELEQSRLEKETKKMRTNRSKSVAVPKPRDKERSKEDNSPLATKNQADQAALLKNLTSTMRRFSTAVNLPNKSDGLPQMPAKFLSSFNNTILDLAPRSVIAKYIDQLDRMSNKGTRYNEPLVLSRIIPKYLREMASAGKPDPTGRETQSILTEIRSFAEWGQYLIEQLTNAVAPLQDLMSDGKTSGNGNSRVSSSTGTSKNGTADTLPDIDQSSTTESSSTKESASLTASPGQPRPRQKLLESLSTEALNGSPMVQRANRGSKNTSPKVIQPAGDKETDNKLPTIRHPFPWR